MVVHFLCPELMVILSMDSTAAVVSEKILLPHKIIQFVKNMFTKTSSQAQQFNLVSRPSTPRFYLPAMEKNCGVLFSTAAR